MAPGQAIAGVEVLLTKELASLTGGVQGSKGEPLTDYVVVAFADDRSKWGYLTRHVRTERPDQSGKFLIEGLPPASSTWSPSSTSSRATSTTRMCSSGCAGSGRP